MNKLFSVLVALSVSVASLAVTNNVVVGSGNIVKEQRQITSVEEIKVGGPLTCEITQGSTPSLTIEADDNVMQYIFTECSGSELSIKMKNQGGFRKCSVKVYVTLPAFSEVKGSAASTTFVGEWRTGNAEIDASSAATVNVEKLTASSAEVDASSAATVNITLDVDDLDTDSSSASTINVKGKATNTKAEASSASSTNLNNTFSYLTARASSAATIKYSYKEGKVDARASSGGSVK